MNFNVYSGDELIGTFPGGVQSFEPEIDYGELNNKGFEIPFETTLTFDNFKWNPYQFYKSFFGLEFIESKYMVDKFQKRKHKKKRINKKWMKIYGFIKVPKKEFYQMGNKIIAHPEVIKLMIRHLDKMQ